MARKLSSYVLVRDDKHKVHMFGPDDDLPAWASSLITLRAAWDVSDEPTQDAPTPDVSETSESTEVPKRRGRPRNTTS